MYNSDKVIKSQRSNFTDYGEAGSHSSRFGAYAALTSKHFVENHYQVSILPIVEEMS